MPTALVIFLFVACAAAGTGIRALASMHSEAAQQRAGTLLVNLCGAFVLGAISRADGDSHILLGIALLGSLTSFSSLVGQVVQAWEAGERRTALTYLLVSIAGGLIAASTGMRLSGAI